MIRMWTLVGGVLLPCASAWATNATYLEQAVYATYSDYTAAPFVGGGTQIAQFGATVSNDNWAVAHRVRLSSPVDGDFVEWYFTKPSGTLLRREATYTSVDQCWTGSLTLCGYSITTWTWPIDILFDQAGTWTAEVFVNGESVITSDWVVTAHNGGGGDDDEPADPSLVLASGDGQIAPPGETLQQPLVVQLLDSEGTPLADESVQFEVSQSPNGAQAYFDGGDELVAVTTDAGGFAETYLTLGDRKEGEYLLAANHVQAGGVQFAATARPPVIGITEITGQTEAELLDSVDPLYRGSLIPGVDIVDLGGDPVGVLHDEMNVFYVTIGSDQQLAYTPTFSVGYRIDGQTVGSVPISAATIGPAQWRLGLPVEVPRVDPKGKAIVPALSEFGATELTVTVEIFDDQGTPMATDDASGTVHKFFRRDSIDYDPGQEVPNGPLIWSTIPEVISLEDDPLALVVDRAGGTAGLPGLESLLPRMVGELLGGKESGGGTLPVLYTDGKHTHRYSFDTGGCDDLAAVFGYYIGPGDAPVLDDSAGHGDIKICGLPMNAVEFAMTIGHEHVHMTDWYYMHSDAYADERLGYTGPWEDTDGDRVIDIFDPVIDPDPELHNREHFPMEYNRLFCHSEYGQTLQQDIRGKDWSCPGSQTSEASCGGDPRKSGCEVTPAL